MLADVEGCDCAFSYDWKGQLANISHRFQELK